MITDPPLYTGKFEIKISSAKKILNSFQEAVSELTPSVGERSLLQFDKEPCQSQSLQIGDLRLFDNDHFHQHVSATWGCRLRLQELQSLVTVRVTRILSPQIGTLMNKLI